MSNTIEPKQPTLKEALTYSKKNWINTVINSDKPMIDVIMYSALTPEDIVELKEINRFIVGVTPRKQKSFILHLVKGSEKES